METLRWWPLVSLAALFVPALFSLGAAAPRRAGLASGAALGAALLFTLGAILSGAAGGRYGVRVDAATCIMLLLVATLGAVIVRFSRTHLRGEPGLDRYLRWLLLTLAAVTVLVVANNLLVMAVAWTGASLALHQLLTFYGDRPAALVAAHKKFLVSRLADVFLAAALAWVYASVGSFDLDVLAAWVEARAELPLPMQLAAVFLVLAVALRSAQLPFHGWLTQVMEAPTPVSALLHAGVVNVGGFVLIRVAPWVAHAPAAQLLLVVIGLVSAVTAALVMTTRVSVKVALAWSTCAQLGFMLLQCGLGLWPLALLHLVAHSVYKAHAFLSAGSTVDHWRLDASAPTRAPVSALRVGLTLAASVTAALFTLTALGPRSGLPPPHLLAELVLALMLGSSLVPLSTHAPAGGLARAALRAAAVVVLYVGWHALAYRLVGAPAPSSSAAAWALAGLGFAGLFATRTALQLRPHGPLAQALHPWLFSGLFLDELFTRLTFRVWPPPPAPRSRPAPRALELRAALEVQS